MGGGVRTHLEVFRALESPREIEEFVTCGESDHPGFEYRLSQARADVQKLEKKNFQITNLIDF